MRRHTIALVLAAALVGACSDEVPRPTGPTTTTKPTQVTYRGFAAGGVTVEVATAGGCFAAVRVDRSETTLQGELVGIEGDQQTVGVQYEHHAGILRFETDTAYVTENVAVDHRWVIPAARALAEAVGSQAQSGASLRSVTVDETTGETVFSVDVAQVRPQVLDLAARFTPHCADDPAFTDDPPPTAGTVFVNADGQLAHVQLGGINVTLDEKALPVPFPAGTNSGPVSAADRAALDLVLGRS